MRQHKRMERHVWTRADLRGAGMDDDELRRRVRDGDLHEVLPGVYCSRAPTTSDKCLAVSVWRPDAVMSHFTALWLHGIGAEPSIIDAYVRELSNGPTPDWLRLRVPDHGIYDDTGAFGPDVVREQSESAV